VRRVAGKLIPEIDDTVAIPQLNVLMSGVRAVMQVGGVIMGDAADVAGKYIAPGGLTADPATATNIRGVGGSQGNAGAPAWTPMLAIESDGVARYLKVTDWTGGAGTKPDIGYIGASGITIKANAPNLNAAKRFGIFSAQSNASGIATVSFGTLFADATAAPAIGFWGVPATAVGGVKVTQVATTLAKTGVQIKVEAPNILSAVLGVLVGATVFVIAIEQ
jgi:hypothetical protein